MNRMLPSSSLSYKPLKQNKSKHIKRAKKEQSSQLDDKLSLDGGGHNRTGDTPIESENPLSVTSALACRIIIDYI